MAQSKLLDGLDLNHKIDSLRFPTIINPDDCMIRNYAPLGSYNWVDCPAPTIIIPGEPRVWKERSLPFKVAPDRGHTFADQNAWRSRNSPLEPIFRAVEITQELLGNHSFSLADNNIDIVTDRNNLRALLKMVRSMRLNEGTLMASKNREFRINAQLASNGRTMLLSRYRSDSGRIKVDPRQNIYGGAFEAATTHPHHPVQATDKSKTASFVPTGYHRIVKYEISDLHLLVRYEVDAMEEESETPNVGALVDNIGTLSLNRSNPMVHEFDQSSLRHIVSGSLIPQHRILEIKSTSKNVKWSDAEPQLFFSQTPALKAGFHKNGLFTAIRSYLPEESEELISAHQDLKSNLPYLVSVLKQMMSVCQQYGHPGKPIAFFWSGVGPMEVFEIKPPLHTFKLPKTYLDSL